MGRVRRDFHFSKKMVARQNPKKRSSVDRWNRCPDFIAPRRLDNATSASGYDPAAGLLVSIPKHNTRGCGGHCFVVDNGRGAARSRQAMELASARARKSQV